MVLKNPVNGSPLSEVLGGTSGADLISAFAGNDTILAGAGDDVAYGGAGNDQVGGGAGNDRLWGGLGDDILSGGDNNDMLYGGLGLNQIGGGAGNDSMYASLSTNYFDGGDGVDTANYGGHKAIVVLMSDANSAGTVNSTGVSPDILANVEIIIGTGFADSFNGNFEKNTFLGGSGADTMFGAGGGDVLTGNTGNDLLIGGAGADTLTGGYGTDIFQLDRATVADLGGVSFGRDLITDFKPLDRLSFAGFEADDPNFSIANNVVATNTAAGTVVSVHLYDNGADLGTVEVAMLAGVHYTSVGAMLAANVII